MYVRVINATGWTWEYVRDEVDLSRLRTLYRGWNDRYPPVSESTALLCELVKRAWFKDSGSGKKGVTKKDDLLGFVDALQGAGMQGVVRKDVNPYK